LEKTPEASSSEQQSQDNHHDETVSTIESFDDEDWGERIPSELPVDTAWEDIYQTSASSLPSSDDDEWDFTTRTSSGESLQSHLLGQLYMATKRDTDRLNATTLIDYIYPHDFLNEKLGKVLQCFDTELDIELDEIEVVLRRIQQ